MLYGASRAQLLFVLSRKLFEFLPVPIISPWREIVVSMKALLINIDQFVDLLDHIPVSLNTVQSVSEVEQTCHWVRQFAVVPFARPIIRVINYLVVNVIIPEVEQDLEILKRGGATDQAQLHSEDGPGFPIFYEWSFVRFPQGASRQKLCVRP
ncbi:MAG: hypothetical protein E6J74_15170 [Deltaproteobacteria bacterium]|nr:MAG: hypothetical protein E6J74_15170 [Deltaproteobacteria bacterium]